jgi:hypothetical protein
MSENQPESERSPPLSSIGRAHTSVKAQPIEPLFTAEPGKSATPRPKIYSVNVCTISVLVNSNLFLQAMDEELSDDQIAQILKDAESRLRQKAKDSEQVDAIEYSFPRLNAGGIEQATYVQQNKHGIAKADQAKLVSEDRKIADQAQRKVDDPLAIKKRKDVRVTRFLFVDPE